MLAQRNCFSTLRKLTTKLPEFKEGGESQVDVALQQVTDRESEKKQQAKHYAEMRYHSKDRPIAVGNAVLLMKKPCLALFKVMNAVYIGFV